MRVFKVGGLSWTARVFDGVSGGGRVTVSGSWEAILFETPEPGVNQRLLYRPAGWLPSASAEDLVAALAEGESVRTRWGTASGDAA